MAKTKSATKMPIHRDREPGLEVGRPRVVIQATLKENERESLAERRGRAEDSQVGLVAVRSYFKRAVFRG